MSYRTNSSMDRKGSNEDDPPLSRLFIICNKTTTEEDFRNSFSQFGNIEDVWVVKDKNTGENKGVAYIKYSKTSEAAAAFEEMNGKTIEKNQRPLKVLVASNRNAGSKRSENEQEKYLRLFLVVNKSVTESELRNEFSEYGTIDNVSVVKDRSSGQSKGFAYIKYIKFSDAATAFENCDPKYRAVFAEPKSSKSSMDRNDNRQDDYYRDSRGSNGGGYYGGNNYNNSSCGGSGGGGGNYNNNHSNEMSGFMRMQNNANQPTSLEVYCSSAVNQDQLWRLFDIIPGLDYCSITRERGPRNNEATVVYTNFDSASYAKEKLHGFEFPPGERLIVKIVGSDSNQEGKFGNTQQHNDLYSDSLCSVRLPPPEPLANSDSHCAQRCFIVLSSGLPIHILKTVFCTFGGLIDVYLLPNKNCGYVKYTTNESAQMAIETLNGAEVHGVRLKVMTAEEPKYPTKRMRSE